MVTLARGDTVTAFDNLPKRYRDVLLDEGVSDQTSADKLTAEEAAQKIRSVQAKVGDGNARRLPLGLGAVTGRNYRTEANRAAVGAWLFRYFAETFEVSAINVSFQRGESVTGAQLHPKTITTWDVDIALVNLSISRHDLYDLLVRRYKYDLPLHEIARTDHRGRKTVSELHREALNLLVDELWRDL